MDHNQFFAGEPPARKALPFWRILRCPEPPGVLETTLVSSFVYPVDTHYNGKTRILCRHENCTPALHQLPARWYGYCQCFHPSLRAIGIVELTLDAFRQIKEISLENSGSLRGLMIRMKRAGKTKQSAVRVCLKEIIRGYKALPDEIDVWPMILRLFNEFH